MRYTNLILFIIPFLYLLCNRFAVLLEKTFVEESNIGDTFLSKRAVKGRCGDFRSKAKKILPDLDCGFLLV